MRFKLFQQTQMLLYVTVAILPNNVGQHMVFLYAEAAKEKFGICMDKAPISDAQNVGR